jgi:hypothetical protein
MKLVLKYVLVSVLIILCLVDPSWAGQTSFSVPVVCIIPAVPGVNAPPFEGEEPKNQANLGSQENQASEGTEEEPGKETPLLIQEEKEETLLAEHQEVKAVVQTVYSR